MQDGIYFDGEGQLVEALLDDKQRDALAAGTLGTPAPVAGAPDVAVNEASANGAPVNFKKLAALYRALPELQQGQFRALTHLVPMEQSSTLAIENASLKRENDKLADLLQAANAQANRDKLGFGNPPSVPSVNPEDTAFVAGALREIEAQKMADGTLVNESVIHAPAVIQGPPPSAPVVDADDDVPPRPSAPVLQGGEPDEDDGPPVPVEKPADPKPGLDLVGWLKGEQEYRVMEVSNHVKSVYGFRGNKAAIIGFLVNEKQLVAAEEVRIS